MSASTEKIAELNAELAPRIQGRLRTDDMTRALYATDASLYQIMPVAVLVPAGMEDVAAAIDAARGGGGRGPPPPHKER
jgi:FAD/FMN-containing dehydrogenase